MLGDRPPVQRIALAGLVSFLLAILIVTALQGMSTSFPLRIVQSLAIGAAGVAVIGAVLSLITSRLSAYKAPETEEDFEALVRRSERLARENLAPEPEEEDFLALDPFSARDFETLVAEALDDLPDLLLRALDHVAVVISDDGRKHNAYGLYHGDGVARDDVPDRIVIFRDTLRRDFGHDPESLREQVTITVRHELAHHLGADELGVRELGL